MQKIKEQRKDSAILLITHNLGVVAETCDRVAVMYGGKMQEVASAVDLFGKPQHPYTKGLLGSLPSVDDHAHDRLRTIPGNVPNIHDLPIGCKFATRCSEVMDKCHDVEPELLEVSPGHKVRCHLREQEH